MLEPYRDCARCFAGFAELDDVDRQAMYGCPVVGRGVAENPIEVHMGAPDPECRDAKPFEDPEDGCPGAWYRCAWVGSVMAYARPIDKNGAFGSNPRLDREDDRLVLDAVLYYEHEVQCHRANAENVRASTQDH